MAAATRAAPASFTSATITCAPCSAIALAIPSPMPEPPPVTRASLPSSSPAISAHQVVGDGTAGRGPAAIHDILRAGDVGSEVGAQEDHQIRHLVGGAVAADRDVGLVAGADAGGIIRTEHRLQRMDHPRIDRPRA